MSSRYGWLTGEAFGRRRRRGVRSVMATRSRWPPRGNSSDLKSTGRALESGESLLPEIDSALMRPRWSCPVSTPVVDNGSGYTSELRRECCPSAASGRLLIYDPACLALGIHSWGMDCWPRRSCSMIRLSPRALSSRLKRPPARTTCLDGVGGYKATARAVCSRI